MLFVDSYAILVLSPEMAVRALCQKTQAADSLLGNLFRKKLDPGWGLLKVFSPGGLVPKGGMSHDIV